MWCKCGQEAEWIFGDTGYCQECWEAECAISWWELCTPFWRNNG